MDFLFSGFGEILAAIRTGDSFEISNALSQPGAWGLGLLIMVIGGGLVLGLFKLVPVLDRHFERTLMVIAYLAIATIIFVEVIRRFVFNLQVPWSTTLPPYLFLLLTWFGCAFNVKLRAHLSFSEFRMRMSRGMQLAMLWLDSLLWLGMCWIVITATLRVTANSASNFQILLGTNNVMVWWFLILVPFSFVILAARAVENMAEDLRNYRDGSTMIEQAALGDT